MGGISIDPKDWLSEEEQNYLKDHVVMSDTQLVTLRWQTFTLMDINSRFQFNFLHGAAAKNSALGSPVLPCSDGALQSSMEALSLHTGDQLGISCSPLKLPSTVAATPISNRVKEEQSSSLRETQKQIPLATASKKRTRKRLVPASEMEDELEMSNGETSLNEEAPLPRRASSRRRKKTPRYSMDDLLREDTPPPPSVSTPKTPKSPLPATEVTLKRKKPVVYAWPEDPCGVCGCSEWDEENMILMCDGKNCNVLVHVGCQGLTTVPEQDPWFCDICSAKVNPRNANCALCPVTGGVLKRVSKLGKCIPPPGTNPNKLFVHTCCALWNPSVSFQNPSSMMNVDLSRLTQEKIDAQCCVCDQGGGAIRCAYRRCTTAFHVLCGRSKKFKGAMREDGTTVMLCEKHSFGDKFKEGRKALLGLDLDPGPVEGGNGAAGDAVKGQASKPGSNRGNKGKAAVKRGRMMGGR